MTPGLTWTPFIDANWPVSCALVHITKDYPRAGTKPLSRVTVRSRLFNDCWLPMPLTWLYRRPGVVPPMSMARFAPDWFVRVPNPMVNIPGGISRVYRG